MNARRGGPVRVVPTTPRAEVDAAAALGKHAFCCDDCGPALTTFGLVCHFYKAVPAAPLAEVLCADGRRLLAAYEEVAT